MIVIKPATVFELVDMVGHAVVVESVIVVEHVEVVKFAAVDVMRVDVEAGDGFERVSENPVPLDHVVIEEVCLVVEKCLFLLLKCRLLMGRRSLQMRRWLVMICGIIRIRCNCLKKMV